MPAALSATHSAPAGVKVKANGLFQPRESSRGRWDGGPSGRRLSSLPVGPRPFT